MNKMNRVRDADRHGVSVTPLFQDNRETVQLEFWDADTDIALKVPQGAEFLVLDGDFEETGDMLREHSWLRLPEGATLNAKTGSQGAKVWVKTRHLPHASAPQQLS